MATPGSSPSSSSSRSFGGREQQSRPGPPGPLAPWHPGPLRMGGNPGSSFGSSSSRTAIVRSGTPGSLTCVGAPGRITPDPLKRTTDQKVGGSSPSATRGPAVLRVVLANVLGVGPGLLMLILCAGGAVALACSATEAFRGQVRDARFGSLVSRPGFVRFMAYFYSAGVVVCVALAVLTVLLMLTPEPG